MQMWYMVGTSQMVPKDSCLLELLPLYNSLPLTVSWTQGPPSNKQNIAEVMVGHFLLLGYKNTVAPGSLTDH